VPYTHLEASSKHFSAAYREMKTAAHFWPISSSARQSLHQACNNLSFSIDCLKQRASNGKYGFRANLTLGGF
jgi:hypothetical protein